MKKLKLGIEQNMRIKTAFKPIKNVYKIFLVISYSLLTIFLLLECIIIINYC